METAEVNHFRVILKKETLHLTNREGILYNIPFTFLAKETNIGGRFVSYQILRLKHSGLFSIDELYSIASIISHRFPASLVNWQATFSMIHKEKISTLHKKLKTFHLL